MAMKEHFSQEIFVKRICNRYKIQLFSVCVLQVLYFVNFATK